MTALIAESIIRAAIFSYFPALLLLRVLKKETSMRLVFQVPKNLFCIGFGVRCYELSPTNIVWRKHLNDLPIFRTVARMRY